MIVMMGDDGSDTERTAAANDCSLSPSMMASGCTMVQRSHRLQRQQTYAIKTSLDHRTGRQTDTDTDTDTDTNTDNAKHDAANRASYPLAFGGCNKRHIRRHGGPRRVGVNYGSTTSLWSSMLGVEALECETISRA